MADDVQTSVAEPDANLTSAAEPETSTPEPSPETAQPSLEEKLRQIEEKYQRLEANNKGTYSEWLREKQARENLENQVRNLQNFQQMQVQQQNRQNEPTDEEIAKQEAEALIDQNYAKLAQIRRMQQNRAAQEANQIFSQQLAQAGAQTQKVQAINNVLNRMGVKDPQNDPIVKKIMERAAELSRDSNYDTLSGKDPGVLFALAAKEIEAENKFNSKATTEKARQMSVDDAATESSAGNSSKQKRMDEKFYFSDHEKKIISMLSRGRDISLAEAERRYWAQLKQQNPSDIERRHREKRA